MANSDLAGAFSNAVSAQEAARLLGVHERTVRRAIHAGELPATKAGGSFQITIDALQRYQQRRTRRDGWRRQTKARPQALPAPLSSFVGRDRDISALAALVRRDDVRLVTLTGPGGVGKTRLALRVATEVAKHFAAGVAFVPLAAVRSADLVLPTIAQTLGASEPQDQAADIRLARWLRERKLLLLLDNVEQVTAAAPALGELLRACPRLTILVTSRAPLRLSGERVVRVPPLALPQRSMATGESGDVPPVDHLAAVEAIQLFVERAQAASADFMLTPENAATIVALCERVDGLPLAIELAAARTRALTPADLLARLSSQLPVLTGGPADQPPRLRSMSNAIAWSYDLLSPTEQTLFRRLAVFVGGFTLEAAEYVGGNRGQEGSRCARLSAVSSPEQRGTLSTLDLLTALIDQSLLQRMPGPGDDTRYGMLEPVREYGLQRLAASGEENPVRDAHAAWCFAFAKRAEDELGGPYQEAWFDWLDVEHPNVRSALTWFRERGDAEGGLRLACCALSWFWSSRGYLREAKTWFEAFLGMPATARTRAFGLVEAANILHWYGDDPRAALYAEEALTIFRDQGDQRNAAYAIRRLGSIAIDRGDLEQAALLLAESGELLQSVGSAWDVAFAIYLDGRLAASAGRCAEAVIRFAEAANVFAAIGDRSYVAAALGQQGAASIMVGDHPTARTAYAQSLRLAQQVNDPSWVSWALDGAAHLAQAGGNSAAAARLLGAAAVIAEAIGGRDRPDNALAGAVRSALGAERFALEHRQGATMAEMAVIAEAWNILGEDGRPRVPERERSTPPSPLTAREQDVVRLLVAGASDKEIAQALGVTRRTASSYVAVIRRKLGVSSRAAAAAVAIQERLLS